MQKTCEICQKTMIADTVKIHIKSHKKSNSLDETHRSGASGEMNILLKITGARKLWGTWKGMYKKCINVILVPLLLTG